MKQLIVWLLLLWVLPLSARAAEAEAQGFSAPGRLTDGSRETVSAAGEDARLTLTDPAGLAGLYVEFDRPPQPWTLEAGGQSLPCGTQGFLHEFVDLAALLGTCPKTVTLCVPSGTAIGEVYAFAAGEAVPDSVQRWEPPLEQADLLLLSTHSDDEQLFFAGVLPYYALERQAAVQVVYLVQHFVANGQQDHRRPHEQLDGLWTVGIRHYPILPDFPDLYAESKDRQTALNQALQAFGAAGYGYQDFVDYLTGCLRRCRPLAVVSHDLDGEYGHGAHVLCAQALTDALTAAAGPERLELGEPWQVQKTYLHLYAENPIVMDFDTPLERLGGRTAFQVTQEGFACHRSQHWTWFYKWIYGTKEAPITAAVQIQRYSPCRYGLYSTQVGPDVIGGDFLENVETYAQRAARAEAEERAAADAAARARAEAAAKAEAEAAAERAAEAAAQAASKKRTLLALAGSVLAAVLAGGVMFGRRRR